MRTPPADVLVTVTPLVVGDSIMQLRIVGVDAAVIPAMPPVMKHPVSSAPTARLITWVAVAVALNQHRINMHPAAVPTLSAPEDAFAC